MANVATMIPKDARPADAANANSLKPTPPGPAEVVLPTNAVATIASHPQWDLLSRIPMRLSATIPLPRFRVRDLLTLRRGTLVTSNWLSSDDVWFNVGDVRLSWSEFEVVEQRIAIRLTRLA